MTCDEFKGMLDAMLDGELDDDARRSMEAHAQACPDCAASLRAAIQLKALFDQMEPEVDVPLEAQAGWRGAVRKASAQRRRTRVYRWIGSIAAAVVVLAGVGLTLNQRGALPKEADAARSAVEEMAPAATPEAVFLAGNAAIDAEALDEAVSFTDAGGAVIEADGGAYEAEQAGAGSVDFEEEALEETLEDPAEAVANSGPVKGTRGLQTPACELTVEVEDVETVCSRLCDLAQEYEGEADVQRLEDGGANLYIRIDAGDAGDFLSAVALMNVGEQSAPIPELSGEGTVQLLLAVRPAS